jgi:MFS family permease
MTCSGALTISMFGMMYFLGLSIGNAFMPTLSDRYGRKKFFVAGLISICLIYITFIALAEGSSNFNMVYVMHALMFITGAQTANIFSTGTCVLSELCPTKLSYLLISIKNMNIGAV